MVSIREPSPELGQAFFAAYQHFASSCSSLSGTGATTVNESGLGGHKALRFLSPTVQPRTPIINPLEPGRRTRRTSLKPASRSQLVYSDRKSTRLNSSHL